MTTLLEYFVDPRDAQQALISISLHQEHSPAIRTDSRWSLSLILKSQEHCPPCFSQVVRNDLELEHFIQSIRSCKKKIKLRLAGPISDNQDEHFAIRRVISAFAQHGEVTGLECNLAESSSWPESLTTLIRESRSLASLQLIMNGFIQYDFRGLASCLEQHASLKKFSFQSRFDHAPWLLQPDANAHHENGHRFGRTEDHIETNNVLALALLKTPQLEEIDIGSFVQTPSQPAWRSPFSITSIRLLMQRLGLRVLRFHHCQFTNDLVATVANNLSQMQRLEIFGLIHCEISDHDYRRIFVGLSKAPSLSGLELHLSTYLSASSALSFYDLLMEKRNSLYSLEVRQKERMWHIEEFPPDYVSYAVVRSLLCGTSLRHLNICCRCMETKWYTEFEELLLARYPRKRVKRDGSSEEVYQPKKASVAAILIEALKTNRDLFLETFDISGSGGFKEETFCDMIRSLSKFQKIKTVNIKGVYTLPAPFLHSKISMRYFMKMGLELAANCSSVESILVDQYSDKGCPYPMMREKLRTEIEADRQTMDTILWFNRIGRDIIRFGSTKKSAVGVLIEIRNDLTCLYEALLLNPALFSN